MNTDELCELFKTKPDCNVIATIGSVLQINCVNAAIRHIENSGEKLTGFIFRLTSNTLSKSTYDLNKFREDEAYTYVDNCSMIGYSKKSERLVLYKGLINHEGSKSRNLYIIGADLIHPILYAVLKVYGRDCNIVFVETDDGIMNYIPIIKTRIHDRIKRKGSKSLLINAKIAFMEFLRGISIKYVLYLVKRQGGYMDCRLLSINKGEGKRNPLIAEEFIHALAENSDNLDYEKIRLLENSVLLVGCWTDDLDYVNWIIDKVKSKGHKVVYRPHPRELNNERLQKINCELFIMPEVALEIILNALKVKPICLLSEYSSSMAYCKVYFGVKAISYSNIKKHQYDSSDQAYLESYKNAFGTVMHFPENIDTLLGLLP